MLFCNCSCTDDSTFSEFHDSLIKRYSVSQSGSSTQLKTSVTSPERTSLGTTCTDNLFYLFFYDMSELFLALCKGLNRTPFN